MAIIDKPSDFFNTVLYTGNGSNRNITGVGHSPDFTWLKARSESEYHFLYDIIRGATKGLSSDLTAAEATYSDGLTAFASDGFSLGTSNGINRNNTTYVSWNWKAGGSASNNTDGQLTSSVSVNQDAGFSVLTYTGVGNGTPATARTVGHGLGVTPAVLIIKNRADSTQWNVYHHKNTSAPETEIIYLNLTNATADDNGFWNDTAPTSSVFTVGGDNGVNGNNDSMVCYAFAEKTGYSKFGSYTGNGNANGTFIYTGFKPAFLIVKNTAVTSSWILFDNKRSEFNEATKYLYPNVNNAEANGGNVLDMLSNGFKIRSSGVYEDTNGSGNSIIYMAFAENPFVASNFVTTTAR